ncbi:hypothetical protein DC31_04120 [Microbacterium sp. CH12i]|uniref:DUF2510 domain-containing protein n=1 Tax=Microbacterium sp. CH12i TaxID=1479651 RepID=UPI000461F631|nr:DUF2510 domain-containing protein [Microbacterium sp. CH12i]KDA05263.1 hypothetical protein DC31_04120 [Microbacterium sp. CH12i]
MNAQPGWYDAGVPGQERWWDGTQWTAHERAVVVAAQAVQAVQAQQPVQAQYAAPVAQAAPMGWFPVVGTSDVRWWDGGGWTPYRLRDGKSRPDAFAIEPASTGMTLGILFIVLGFTQFNTYSLSGQPGLAITPVLFLASGVIWLIGSFRVSQLKKLSVPSTVPVFDPSTRPLPGEAEGAGAGWYPVAGRVTRWWTGTQWSHYVGQKFGVRPAHAGARGYRVSMIAGWVLAGVGALGVVLGIAMIALLDRWVGVAVIIPAVILGLAGGLIVLLTYIRRYTMILPTQAPPLR